MKRKGFSFILLSQEVHCCKKANQFHIQKGLTILIKQMDPKHSTIEQQQKAIADKFGTILKIFR